MLIASRAYFDIEKPVYFLKIERRKTMSPAFQKKLYKLAKKYQDLQFKYHNGYVPITQAPPILHQKEINQYKDLYAKLSKIFKLYLTSELANAKNNGQVIAPIKFIDFKNYLHSNNKLTDQEKGVINHNLWLIDIACYDKITDLNLEAQYQYNYFPKDSDQKLVIYYNKISDIIANRYNIRDQRNINTTLQYKASSSVHEKSFIFSQFLIPLFSLTRQNDFSHYELVLAYYQIFALLHLLGKREDNKVLSGMFEYLTSQSLTTIAYVYIPE